MMPARASEASRNTWGWPARLLRATGIAVAVVALFFAGFIVFFEESLIFYPARGGVGPSPGQDVFLTTSDGVKIHGWYVTHPEAKAAILYLHGNAGNIEIRRDVLEGLRQLPANVLLIDYRGYGNSEGRPSEVGIYRDARAAYDWLAARTPPERIVVFGKSLGGAPACELAAGVPVGGLIVQSSFTRATDMASIVMPFLPGARFLVRSKFDTIGKVARIRCPKLFIHAVDDDLIPFSMARRLYDAAAEPKEHAWFDSGGHGGLWITHHQAYYARLRQFLNRLSPAPR